MINYNFAVYILTHQRADNVITYDSLKAHNYTGKIYFVLDNTDTQIKEYEENFGEENVRIFDKQYYHDNYDTGNNLKELAKSIFYARNAVFDIAKKDGVDYFLVLDDDYPFFAYRYADGETLRADNIKNLDNVINLYLDYFSKLPENIKSICFAQGGDYIGGVHSSIYEQRVLRKAMNALFFKTNNPIEYIGEVNEDVNTYVLNNRIGNIFFTFREVMVGHMSTQSQAGGMTDLYLDMGTYYKSFYSVMYIPSAVKISTMGRKNRRIHHKVFWNDVKVPILSDKYKKGVENG